MTREQRAAEVRQLRDQGLPYREVADRLGISLSYAHELYVDPSGEQANIRKLYPCEECGGPMRGNRRCRSCQTEAERSIEYRREVSRRTRGKCQWSDDDLLRILREAAVDGVVTATMYQERRTHPHYQTFIYRFGSWNKAVALAGLTASRHNEAFRSDRVPTEGLVMALQDCAEDLGCLPSYSQYTEWARDGGAPSPQSIRNRFGSWMDALKEIA